VILFLKAMVSGYTRSDGVRVSPYYRQADAFADRAHAGQYRKGAQGAPKVPYIEHPRAVVGILHDEAGITDRETLIAALLHDTIEDAGTTHAQLQQLFGQTVADTVRELTNDPDTPPGGKKASQIAHARTMSPRACAIKVADKTANLRDILNAPPPWPTARKRQYFEDAREVVGAMKHRHALLNRLFETTYLTGVRTFVTA
jgi:guanosine-3',5'-bis(diphosphate) 3'-pyrophosphohydrolase